MAPRPHHFRRILAAVLGISLLTAAKPAPKQARPDGPVKETTLDNGLEILVLESSAAPLVSVWAWYRVGSRHERPGLTGISHFVEHMNFKGTEEIPKAEMTRLVERHGGTFNGYTWLDQTAYVETVPAAALEDVIRLEAQRMSKSLFAEADVETERNVVISERQGGENDPVEALDEEVVGAAFKAHPYQWPTIGWLSDLKAIKREDLVAHYRAGHTPSNAVLVVVGDVKNADVVALAKKHFGEIPAGEPIREPATAEPPQEGERRVQVQRPSKLRYLQVSYKAPALSDPDFAAYLVAEAVLGGAEGVNLWTLSDESVGRTSRLYPRLVANGLATDAKTFFAPTRTPFLESIRVTVADGADLARVEAAVFEAAERLGAQATQKDVDRAKSALSARLVFEAASNTNVAHQIGLFEALDPKRGWRAFYALPGEVAGVKLADVKRVVEKWFVPANRTVGWMVPPDVGTATKPAGERAAAEGSPIRRYTGRAVPALFAVDPKKQPQIGPKVVREVLGNGVVVLAMRNPIAPEVLVRVDVNAGSALEPAEKAGLASLTGRLLAHGTTARNADAIADAFESVGATLEGEVDLERSTVESRMLTRDFATLVPLLREIAASPTFPPEQVERERAKAIAEAKQRDEDTASVAESTLLATIYAQADPRGRHPDGKPDTIAAITRADVGEFHRTTYRPERTVVVISGDLDPAQAIKVARRAFGGWRATGSAKRPAALPTEVAAPVPGWIGRVFMEGKTQTDVVVGWPQEVTRAHKDWTALNAVNTLLGGMGLGGRIGRAVREEKGLAYYAWSELDAGDAAGPFLVRAGVDPKNAEEALATIKDVLAKTAAEGFREDEAADVKTLLAGQLARAMETNGGLAAFYADVEHYRLGIDYPKRYTGQVQALSLDELNRAAKTYLHTDVATVTAGPKPKK